MAPLLTELIHEGSGRLQTTHQVGGPSAGETIFDSDYIGVFEILQSSDFLLKSFEIGLLRHGFWADDLNDHQ